LGKGTTFSFALPLPAITTDIDLPNSLAGKSLLLADGHPAHRAALVRQIAHMGMKVAEAQSAGECLAQVVQLGPDVIVMDHELPGMAPEELAHAFPKIASPIPSGGNGAPHAQHPSYPKAPRVCDQTGTYGRILG